MIKVTIILERCLVREAQSGSEKFESKEQEAKSRKPSRRHPKPVKG